jgi:hypothetical protein
MTGCDGEPFPTKDKVIYDVNYYVVGMVSSDFLHQRLGDEVSKQLPQ